MTGDRFTPGPWRWEVNRHSRIVHLCGGRPPYDWTVLSFKRWGPQQAAPVFWSWGTIGEPHRADELAAIVPGREHHADWFADIDHPDARLIASAPELLGELERAIDHLEAFARDHSQDATAETWAILHCGRGAISKARGQS